MRKKVYFFFYLVWIACLLLILAVLVRISVLDQLHRSLQSVRIRVAYYPSQMVFAGLSPYGPGLEAEMVETYCSRYGLRPIWQRVNSFEQGFSLLQYDKADLFVSGGHIPPARHVQIEPKHAWPQTLQLLFNARSFYPFITGPPLRQESSCLIHSKDVYHLRQLRELCSSSVLMKSNSAWMQPFEQTLARIRDCDDSRVMFANGNTQFFLHDLDAKKTRFGLMTLSLFQLWQPFYPSILRSDGLEIKLEDHWFWSSKYLKNAEQLEVFCENFSQSPVYKELIEKYLGFLPAKADSYQISHFIQTVLKRLPRYSQVILEAGQEYGIDPLWLVPMIYQESHFNPHARSRTGVRGMLQLSLATAMQLGIKNRLNPASSIRGGTRYFRHLWDRLEEKNLSPWNRLFFTLAAYNQGLGHVWDAMDLAKDLGKNPQAWSDVKQIFPLLSKRKYYRQSRFGYCRGYEAVDYVQNIRYYYYILYGLTFLGRPESENLTVLLRGRPRIWP